MSDINGGYLKLEEGNLLEDLIFCGLSAKEAKIYYYLLKNGSKEVSEISSSLMITKADVYKLLKQLEGKGISNETLSHPIKFEASPLPEALNSLILKQDERLESLSRAREEVISALGRVPPPTTEPKFQVLQGREPTTSKIRRIRRSTSDAIIYVRERTLTFLHALGLLDVREISKGLSVRILTKLTPKTYELVKEYAHCEFRSIRDEADMRLPEFAVFDKKEALMALSASEKSAIIDKDEPALWTDSEAPIALLAALFEKMWTKGEKP
jgi:sugar-specific transcriptional regulator TrmB